MLGNGMGGIDWSGLEVLAARFGVEDIEGLIDRLEVVKNHDPKREEDRSDNE